MAKTVDTYEEYTGHESGWQGESDWHAVYTITLGELLEDGVFDWQHSDVNWREAATSDEQYDRVCKYFIERFRWREISIIPYKEWAARLKFRLIFELMPKYKPLYERIDAGVNPFQNEDEYYKERSIMSAYPETLLSENADYITDGTDKEYEKVIEGDFLEKFKDFTKYYKYVDEMMLNELESMFICMYTVKINGE